MVLFGTVLCLLPTFAPVWSSNLWMFEEINAGLAELSDIKDQPDKATYGKLTRKDSGYVKIYNILREIDNKLLPPIDEVLELPDNNKFGEISSINLGISWKTSKTKFNPITGIFFIDKNNVEQPICEMSILKMLIRDYRNAFFSRWGLFFLFFPLFLRLVEDLKHARRAGQLSLSRI